MEMFFCSDLAINSSVIFLPKAEAHHAIRVFRKKPNESLYITNGHGLLATASIEDVSPNSVTCQIQNIEEILPSSSRLINVAISTIRPNRMNWAIEKLTELGVGCVQPVHAQHTCIKTFKKEHLQKITISAIKQSKQVYMPELLSPLPFLDWLSGLKQADKQLRFLAHLNDAAKSFPQIKPILDKTTWIAIGPEGGFTQEEISQASHYQFRTIKLADQLLRAETAAVTAVAQAKLYCY